MLGNAQDTGLSFRPGQRIGLLGGSFDPPHAGHANITREALRRFGLDRVVWLVSPGNPLKPHGPAPLAERMAASRALVRHPDVQISDFELRAGTRYTARTLDRLTGIFPHVRFVWLMGADNLAQFHRWEDWRRIMKTVPVGILARPGSRLMARNSVAAETFRHARIPARNAKLLAMQRPPAWCFVNVPMTALSSTELRSRSGAKR